MLPLPLWASLLPLKPLLLSPRSACQSPPQRMALPCWLPYSFLPLEAAEMDGVTSLFFFSSTAIKCHWASLRSELTKETKGTGREPQFPQNQQDPFLSKVYPKMACNYLLCTQIERQITVTVAHDSEIQRQRQQHPKRTLVTPIAYTVDSVSHHFQPQRLKLDSNRTDVGPLSIGTEQ